MLVAIGKTIRVTRMELGMSQESLAHGASVDRSYMGGIERGEHNMTTLNLQRIAEHLGLTMSELFQKAGW